jgi:hypothetical protein
MNAAKARREILDMVVSPKVRAIKTRLRGASRQSGGEPARRRLDVKNSLLFQ